MTDTHTTSLDSRGAAATHSPDTLGARLRSSVHLPTLRLPLNHHPASTWWVLVLWLAGGWIDIVTTYLMMQRGFVEGNPVALAGMNLIGLGPFLALTGVACVALALLACSCTRTLFARVILGSILFWGVVKMTVALNNIGIWVGLPPVPGLG